MNSCATCRYFVPRENVKDPSTMGRCHRYPKPDIYGFPIVFDTDWCGEHTPKGGGAAKPSLLNPRPKKPDALATLVPPSVAEAEHTISKMEKGK